MELRDKVALVTGGARRVGKAIALALAREGMHVFVHYGHAEEAARETVAEIQAMGVRAASFRADLHDPEQIAALFAALEAEFGRLDVLVNSAANFVRQPFEEGTVQDWKNVMQVNLRAPYLCTQHAARLMRRTPRPPDQPAAVVNITDLIGLRPRRNFTLHGVSKAGLVHLTRAAALELGPDVRVNAVAPGLIMPPTYMEPESPLWQAMGARVPLERTGHPDHVGQAVVFLARHDYITGIVLPVDGGQSLLSEG